MARLTEEDLRRSTLSRQFPLVAGHGPAEVLELFGRLGPIQSQVPRAPFLTASSRLPGVAYRTVSELFAGHQLVKTSNLRGTVHTSVADQFGALDVIARRMRTAMMRKNLGLEQTTPEEVLAEIERFTAADWQARPDILDHVRGWFADHDPGARIENTLAENLVWGHSALLRRPKDERWEKRTDIFHRLATAALPDLRQPDFDTALTEMVRIHLGAYGPATREDLAFFFGTGLGVTDRAIARLGDEVVVRPGPARDDYLDLAEPPPPGDADPGLRLLPEFDGLLLGFQARNRDRFITPEQLPQIWAKANGLFSPVVLHDGRIVASWKTLTKGSRTDLEVTMLTPYAVLADDLFDSAVTAAQQGLDLTIGTLRVRPAP
ncbi:MAG TPA: crosslink repair DNA glycosylase YcaQ family protein [Propionibacteriaceae bacterium]